MPTIQEKIVELIHTIYDVEFREKEVMVPLVQEIPKEIIVEKAVEIQKIIEKILQVPQLITKKEVINEIHNIVEVKELTKEVAVEYTTIKEIDKPRNVLIPEVRFNDRVKEVAVKVVDTVETIKPVPYIVEKLVINNNYHREGVPILHERPVWLNYETIREVDVPRNYYIEKEVPHTIYKDRRVDVRAVLERIKEVHVRPHDKQLVLNNTSVQYVNLNTEKVKYETDVKVQHITKSVPIQNTEYKVE